MMSLAIIHLSNRIMKLTKKIPAKTRTVEFKWVERDFLQCTDRYLVIRGKVSRKKNPTMTKCDWCKHEFIIGEWIGLACPSPNQSGPKRNWALCQDCCDIIVAPAKATGATL